MYLRKSRADLDAEARGEGETFARHEKALLELGGQLKLEITRIYREIVSGETISARPVMRQLLSEVEQGAWEGVLVMEVERLARGDTIDQGIVAQTFKLSDTKIITPMKTYDPNNEYDEEYFEFGLFMSRREYKTINRRLQRGRIASVKEGKYVGNKPPYGYERIKLEHDKGYTLKPDPEQAPVVRMIFALYAYGERQPDGTTEQMGISKIVRRLNDLFIPTVRGGSWVNGTLQNMLRNPVYIGKIRWSARPVKKKMVGGRMVKERPRAKDDEWVLADGLHEPLIDRQTWEEVQRRLQRNPGRPCPGQYRIRNSLAGLVVCGVCGRKMVRRPAPRGSGPDLLMCPAASCGNVSSSLKTVEDRVLLSLQQWLDQYTLIYERRQPVSYQIDLEKKILRNAQNELRDLEKRRDNIYDLLEKGLYTTEIFLERSRSIDEKIAAAQNQIAQINPGPEQDAFPDQSWWDAIPRTERILAQYQKAETPAEKNELLKSVIGKVVYTKTVNGRWHGQPDDFELLLYPKLRQKDADNLLVPKNSPILK
jgi:Site-specific recombinases, DNA invertase Pin homologs